MKQAKKATNMPNATKGGQDSRGSKKSAAASQNSGNSSKVTDALRSRSKRSIVTESEKLSATPKTVKIANKRGVSAKLLPSASAGTNNNAVVASTSAPADEQPIVGSAKSLISALKVKHSRKSVDSFSPVGVPVVPKKGKGGPVKHSAKVVPPEDDQGDLSEHDNNEPDGDGISVSVNSSEDDYSGPEASSSESESDSDQGDQSEGEGSFSEPELTPIDGNDLDIADDERARLKELRKDPQVRRMLDLMYEEDQDRLKRKRRRSETPQRHDSAKRRKSTSKGKNKSFTSGSRLKSPSDVTLYAPALKRDCTVACSPTLVNLGRARVVNDYISEIAARDHSRSRERSVGTHADSDDERPPAGRRQAEEQINEGRRLADRFILEAEQFKASVQPPKGNGHSTDLNTFGDFMRFLADNQDDDFFHLTCHLEEALKSKIEKGEFVDLDRLLPKTRTQVLQDGQSLQQFINRDGSTYWAPPSKDSRITNVRRWEQAFRVYAAVFCNANPHRSAEIWQYVYVINTAASSYVWENVYYYDITFRQLMAKKPHRSWAKTYNQLWNLAMCEPLQKNAFGNRSGFGGSGGDKQGVHPTGSDAWKHRCCWRYNKGNRCKKWNCSFEHRCSFCGGYSHNYQNCNKRSNGSRQNFKQPAEAAGSGSADTPATSGGGHPAKTFQAPKTL